jgi:general secretion pathway protein C
MSIAHLKPGQTMLDLFFRKYAWTATLALLFAGAWLVARTVNTVAGAAIRPRPQADAGALSAPPPRPALPTNLDPDKLYRLIGVEPPKVVEGTVAAAAPVRPQTCADRAARPVKSDLRLLLVVAVQAEEPSQSLVTLADSATRESRVLGVGEEFGGAKLLGVERLKEAADPTGNAFKMVAVICNGGTKEYLDGDAGAGTPADGNLNLGVAQLPGRPAGARPPGGQLDGVRKLTDNRYEIDKTLIDSSLSNLNSLATQARLVPSFKNGVANGFKLFQIQPGSLYSSIGIENGDVITRINGYEINSPDKALEIYSKLRESSHVTLELDRGGQNIKKDYSITP